MLATPVPYGSIVVRASNVTVRPTIRSVHNNFGTRLSQAGAQIRTFVEAYAYKYCAESVPCPPAIVHAKDSLRCSR